MGRGRQQAGSQAIGEIQLAFTCGVDDNNMFACQAGDHGLVFTPDSTTLF
ncbi:MAG TPA: hypothetical protein VG187_10730 [Mycobacterium sp.]|nr:hypothetical protein [Mycobacterium sp.]